MYLLDTYAWVEFFRGTNKGTIVKRFLEKGQCFTCVISFAELAEWCAKEELDCEKYLKAVNKLSIVVNLDSEILQLAGRINFEQKKRVKNWGMIDSIILTTAKIHGLRIVTGDTHFRKIKGTVLI